jgi:biopolymer transport protein ExbB
MNAVRKTLRSCIGLFLLLVIITVATSVPLHAQDGEAAPDAAAADADTTAPQPTQNQLYWIIHTSGWIGGVLLLISFYFVALVTQLFLELREQVIAPQELLARDAIDRQGEAVTVELERRISMLAVIGSLGPMIGLLGTLKGMIASFSVIAMSGTQIKSSEVAGGISEALLITFEGVALSVPAIYFFALFKNRVSTLTVQTINKADEFLRRFHTVVQTKPTAPAAPVNS